MLMIDDKCSMSTGGLADYLLRVSAYTEKKTGEKQWGQFHWPNDRKKII